MSAVPHIFKNCILRNTQTHISLPAHDLYRIRPAAKNLTQYSTNGSAALNQVN